MDSSVDEIVFQTDDTAENHTENIELIFYTIGCILFGMLIIVLSFEK